MKITRDNYESFFIDYIEGNLPESKIDQFLDFLNQNPDLKEELHHFEEVNLPADSIVFLEKNQLHKNATDENRRLENSAIAYFEGDWDADQYETAETFLAANPEFKREYDLIAKTQLKPDSGVKYPEKRKLYRKSGATIVMTWIGRAAAVLVLVWGISSLIRMEYTQETHKINQELAGISPKRVSKVIDSEPEKINTKTTLPVKAATARAKNIQEQTKYDPEQTIPVDSGAANRDLTAWAKIKPLAPQLNQEIVEIKLAFSRSVNVMKINETKNVMSVEGFLASRAKKAGKEGLFSAQRIARLGLNLASEISGERIGYQVKNGKIASVDFESKLMAFSIPLEKR